MTRYDGDLSGGGRKATNISLDMDLVKEARALGINLSRACESGLVQQIAQERGRRWLADNEAALVGANDWVEKRGLPLARYRQF